MEKEETIEYIVRTANDMETIENFMGCTGRFVGSMYHVSIKSMAAHIRAQPPQPSVDLEVVQACVPYDRRECFADSISGLGAHVAFGELLKSLLPPKESK